MSYRKVLCPVDFSTCSSAALGAAIDLVRGTDGVLTIMTVTEFPTVLAATEVAVDMSFIVRVTEIAEKALADWKLQAEQAGVLHVDTLGVQSGGIWSEIVATAKRGEHDLIVLGTHGRSGIAHAILGSVAERVVQHAACPVLVVRAPAIGD